MSLPITGAIICIAMCMVMFVARKWNWSLIALSVLYLGSFLMLMEIWALEQAAIVLVGGWMAAAVLGASSTRSGGRSSYDDAGAVFRLLIFTLLLLVAWSLSNRTDVLIPGIQADYALVGILLVAVGFVRSGIVQDPMHVVLSLILAFAGFEILYAFVNTSALMTAMLATIKLGLGLVGAYLSIDLVQDEGVSE